MTPRSLALASLSLSLLIACGGREDDPGDAGGDAGSIDAGSIDAGATDGAIDGGAIDGSIDGGAIDGSIDGGAIDAAPPFDGGRPLARLRESWCTPLARAACRDRFTCGCGGERPPPELETCVANDVSRCADELEARLAPYLADGRLRADEAALETCARRLGASFEACSATREDVAQACMGILVAPLAIGESCVVSDALCAGGAGSCVTGECAPLPTLGASCADSGQCAIGLACRDDVCVALAADGEACGRDGHCAGDALCVAGTCHAARAALGAACTETAECVAGARCDAATCAATAGGACVADADCASLASCAARRTRVCRAPTPLGSACLVDVECGPSGYCDDAAGPGVCAELRGAGQSCVLGDRQCRADAFCDVSLSPPTCRAVGAIGAPCAPTGIAGRDGCEPHLSCVAGACAEPPGPGAECADDQECASGLACHLDPTAASGYRCGTPGEVGDPCSSFGARRECEDGLFCDGSSGSGVCVPQRGSDEACDGVAYECHAGLTCLRLADGTGRCVAPPSEGSECSEACADALVCADGTLGGVCTPTVCEALPGSERS